MPSFTSTSARWLLNIPAPHRPSMLSIRRVNILFEPQAFNLSPEICKQSQTSIRKRSKIRASDGEQSSIRARDTSDLERPAKTREEFESESKAVEAVSVAPDAAPDVSVPVGRAILCGVTVLWGLYGVLLRFIYSNPGPPLASVLTLVRKALSVAFFLLALTSTGRHLQPSTTESSLLLPPGSGQSALEGQRGVWRAALELGLWSFAGTALQTEGLHSTSATRAAFEIQTTNVIVPLLSSLSGEIIGGQTWGAALGALVGVGVLGSGTGGATAVADHPLASISLMGDLEVLGAAFFYGLTSVRLGVHSRRHSPLLLTSAQMTVALLMSAVWTATDLWRIQHSGGDLSSAWTGWQNGGVLLAITFSAIGCGAFAAWGQAIGQRVVKAAEAQVLYSLQPVWAATFAALFLGEEIAPVGYVGGAIVLLATYIAGKKKMQKT